MPTVSLFLLEGPRDICKKLFSAHIIEALLINPVNLKLLDSINSNFRCSAIGPLPMLGDALSACFKNLVAEKNKNIYIFGVVLEVQSWGI